jgi:hypothetical protein
MAAADSGNEILVLQLIASGANPNVATQVILL